MSWDVATEPWNHGVIREIITFYGPRIPGLGEPTNRPTIKSIWAGKEVRKLVLEEIETSSQAASEEFQPRLGTTNWNRVKPCNRVAPSYCRYPQGGDVGHCSSLSIEFRPPNVFGLFHAFNTTQQTLAVCKLFRISPTTFGETILHDWKHPAAKWETSVRTG